MTRKAQLCATLLLAATFIAFPALAQSIIKESPTPSREDWAPVTFADGRDYSMSETTQVVMLGTGTPLGSPAYNGISVAVIVNNKPYIFDAGPGIYRSMQAATPAMGGKFKALESSNIDTLFLTHLHFDHTEGVPEFILAPWSLHREAPPTIYGPPGTEDLVKNVLEAYRKTIDVEMFGLQPVTKTGWRATAKDVLPGIIFKDQNITVTAINNHHGSWDYSYVYRIETPDRIIVISGDTAPFDGWEEAYKDADILIHEAYSYDPNKDTTDIDESVLTTYMSEFHTSTKQLANILKKVKPKVAVIYHYVQYEPEKTRTNQRAVEEIKATGYDGTVIQARDMDIY